MNPRSIGFRLTVWYAAALTVALLLLAGGMWFAVERSLYDAIDDGLRERVEGIRRFIEDHRDRLALKEVQEEFRAHGDLFQVRDEAGRWLHQADGLRGLTLPPAASEKLPPRFDTVQAGALRLRVISQDVEVGGKTFSIQAAASLRELREGLRRALRVLIPLFATVLIASAAGGYWLSRRALNPVDEITRAARSVTASNLSRRVPVPRTRDELERLSETLNEMIARLESAFKRITHFTADASHELRTPLAVMRTTAEVALRNPDADEHRDALEQILAELGHTTNLVDNLLLMANADSGAERLARTRLDVAEAVREAAAEAAVLARAKSLSFEARLPRDEIWIAGDRQALRRLFLILLDNAVKYTPSGGRVEISAGVISAGVQDARAVICVTDSGVGIAAEHVPHIFDRFYRVDRARSRSTAGAGLGLAIGRWIAEAHDGALSVASEVGRGSRFTFEVPAIDAATAATAATPTSADLRTIEPQGDAASGSSTPVAIEPR